MGGASQFILVALDADNFLVMRRLSHFDRPSLRLPVAIEQASLQSVKVVDGILDEVIAMSAPRHCESILPVVFTEASIAGDQGKNNEWQRKREKTPTAPMGQAAMYVCKICRRYNGPWHGQAQREVRDWPP